MTTSHEDENHHDDVMSFAIDPAKPILSEPLGTYPAQEQLFAHERMITPLDERAVVGTWGMNLILPGDEDGCLSSDWNQCGRLAEFDGDGTGEVDGRLFTWSISGAGTLLVDMVDQTGSVELIAQTVQLDGSINMLSKTRTNGNNYVYHSAAVKRDPLSLSLGYWRTRFVRRAIDHWL
jgi:hypothetical protein